MLCNYNRQEAVKQIAQNCDYFSNGVSNSSNSLRLVEVAKIMAQKAILVEDVDSLNLNIFDNIKNIGITASASSPEIAEKLLEKLKKILI